MKPKKASKQLRRKAKIEKEERKRKKRKRGQVYLTVYSLIEAMSRVSVRSEDGDPVPEILETDGGVDDQPLGAADAEIGVDEHDVACPLAGGLGWRWSHCDYQKRVSRRGSRGRTIQFGGSRFVEIVHLWLNGNLRFGPREIRTFN